MSILGALGTVVSSGVNMASQAMTNAQNRQQVADAYRKQSESIRQMNVYNSPAFQVARLKAAGLSPSLAYGANGEVVGNQSDIPSYTPIPSESPKSADLGAAFRDSLRVGLEEREQFNRDNLAMAELSLTSARAYMMVTQGQVNEATATETMELMGYKIQDYENKFVMDSARYSEIMQSIDESKSRVGLNDKQMEQLDSLIRLNDASATEIYALLPAKLRNLDADTLMKNASAGLYNAEIGKVAQEVETLQFNRWMDKKQFNFNAKQYNNSLKMWQAEQKISIEEAHAERFTSIMRVLIGGAMIRKGLSPASNQRQPSPIITPSGGQMFGQNWSQ